MNTNAHKDLVYIITGLNRAGAELVCLSQATHFSQLGYRVGVVYLVEGDDQLVPDFQAIGVETWCLGMRSMLALPQALWRCRQLLRTWRPRLVHSHMVHATLLASLIMWTLPGTKLIATAHSIREGGRLLNGLQRLTRSAPSLATNVSEEATAAYIAQGLFRADRAKCIPNGVDLDRFSFQADASVDPDQVFTFVCVARFRIEKNHPALLRAFAKVHAMQTSTRLLLVGDGPLLSDCQALASALGIAEAVTFAGGHADIVAMLRSARAFVLVSHYEGFGLAAAEAMAVGLPIVGSNVPGLREVIGGHGVLVAPNDIDAIAAAMMRIVDTPDTISDRLRRRSHIDQHFSRDAIFAQWEWEYRRLGLSPRLPS